MPITSPLDIAGCNLWFDTKDLATVTKDGSNKITALLDKSPAARHIITAIGNPIHGMRLYQGHPAVDLTPADSLESGTHTDLPQPSTIFFVGGFDSDTDGMQLFRSSWSGHLQLTRNSTGFHRLNISGAGISAAPSPLTGAITVIVMDGASSSIDVDGVVTTGDLGATGPGNKEMVGVGCDGWFCQYIRFDSVLSPTQIQDVKDWMAEYLADAFTPCSFLPPTDHDYIQMTTVTVPPDSIVFGDTFTIDSQVAYELTADHDGGSTGIVHLDPFAVFDITGTAEAGIWDFDYWLKDLAGDNSAIFTVTHEVSG